MFNKEDEPELGRLKHTTKENCEDCGKSKMQLRARMVEGAEAEYLYCPKCGFEKEDRKIKLVEIRKRQAREISQFEEKIAVAQELKNKNKYKRRNNK